MRGGPQAQWGAAMVLWRDGRWVHMGLQGSIVQCMYVIWDCLSWVHLYRLGDEEGGELEGPRRLRAEYEVFTVGKSVITFFETLYQLDSIGNVGVILNSGTSIMRLVEPSYIIFWDSFQAATSHLKSVAGDSLFNMCYTIKGGATNIPTVNLLFQNKVLLKT
jgi:hypothetical protein